MHYESALGRIGGWKGGIPDPLGSAFGLVYGDHRISSPNTATGDGATHEEERESRSSDLHGNIDGEDDEAKDNGPPPAGEICGRPGK